MNERPSWGEPTMPRSNALLLPCISLAIALCDASGLALAGSHQEAVGVPTECGVPAAAAERIDRTLERIEEGPEDVAALFLENPALCEAFAADPEGTSAIVEALVTAYENDPAAREELAAVDEDDDLAPRDRFGRFSFLRPLSRTNPELAFDLLDRIREALGGKS